MVARGLARRHDGGRQRRFARQMGGELPYPDRFHRGQGGVQIARDQCPDLVQRPGLDYLRRPQIAVGLQSGTLRLDHQTGP